ncbi:hypothetical protein QJQ45_005938 [Haematococcus lacustris]|nr:hypothetical protein QJQ45_005938 [Haematococcus lacustris]
MWTAAMTTAVIQTHSLQHLVMMQPQAYAQPNNYQARFLDLHLVQPSQTSLGPAWGRGCQVELKRLIGLACNSQGQTYLARLAELARSSLGVEV